MLCKQMQYYTDCSMLCKWTHYYRIAVSCASGHNTTHIAVCCASGHNTTHIAVRCVGGHNTAHTCSVTSCKLVFVSCNSWNKLCVPYRSQYAAITLTTSRTASMYPLLTKCVIFSKVLTFAPWRWFPYKPKHVGAVLLILECFNNYVF